MHSLHTIPRFLAVLAVLALAFALPAAGFAPSPPVLKEDGASFVRVGQTTFRWKSILKVYDIALHLGTGQKAPRALADVPMRLELVYHRAFTSNEIIKSGDALMRRNLDPATFDKLAPRLAELNRAYVGVKPGDAYALTYVPGRGTTLRLNGNALATIPGYDFADSYFRIWLGDDPISGTIRDELLGR
jgi:hypothetical protein